ncbi:MAG TPA: recombinase RecA [bacterium]|nr:recombinase RecA [bacterium]
MAIKHDDREQKLRNAITQIEKSYGKGAIMRMGERGALMDIEVIPTGSLALDLALGIGGVPRGRVVEIYGPDASGKTTLALSIVAEAQKRSGVATFVDVEHALDPTYAEALGVNMDSLYVSQPDTGEQALEIVDTLVRSTAVDIIVVDSVAALVPRAEIEGEMGEPQMGLQARLMSQALRKLTGAISKTKTCVIFVNQVRQKIGVMFGNPETTTGGKALKFYASVRLDIRRIASLKAGAGEIIGNRTRIKVAKNKLAPPFKQVEFDIIFGEGISKEGTLIDMGLDHGVIQKGGTWFSFKDQRIGQGRENTRKFLKENKAIALEIENALREELHLPLVASPKSPEDAKPNEG